MLYGLRFKGKIMATPLLSRNFIVQGKTTKDGVAFKCSSVVIPVDGDVRLQNPQKRHDSDSVHV